MKYLLILLLCMPLISVAQNDEKGIHWTTGLSWEQVTQKARQEKKFIFLDFYTTWCGPCKQMDNTTYPNEEVGNYFNEKFISVRVQMDKTDKDDINTKKWYRDAEAIGKQYHITGYPTYIFLTPEISIINRAAGFMSANDFVALAKTSTTPGRTYNDETTLYHEYVKDYKSGNKDYAKYPFMIKMALDLSDTALGNPMLRELNNYVAGLPLKDRYTQDRVGLWAGYLWPSNRKVFQFFYKDSKQINKVMEQRWFAEEIVDRTIQNEICLPFMEAQAKGTNVAMRGMHLTADPKSGIQLKVDSSEADWKELYKLIKKKYGRSYAKRSLFTAKIEWYGRHNNYNAQLNSQLQQLKTFPPDTTQKMTYIQLNNMCWTAFLNCNDQKLLKECVQWIQGIRRFPQVAMVVDTYANLLYKTGRKEEAIYWEQKAIDAFPNDKGFQATLNKMKQGLSSK